MEGTLVYLEERTSKNGKTYWRIGVKDDSGKTQYTSVFSKPAASRGDRVRVEDGKVISLGKEITRKTSQEDRRSINRSVALKAAADVVAAIIQSSGAKIGLVEAKDYVLQTAETFLEWLEEVEL